MKKLTKEESEIINKALASQKDLACKLAEIADGLNDIALGRLAVYEVFETDGTPVHYSARFKYKEKANNPPKK